MRDLIAMILYKFRSAANLSRDLDILVNRRLYCAPWRQLNDIAEGTPVMSCPPGQKMERYMAYGRAVYKHMAPLRICSFSRTFDSHLLWGHYASGWDGFAIELEIPGSSKSLHEVQYTGFMCCIDPNQYSPSIDAIRVLSTKHHEWAYEQESRIITKKEYFELVLPIRMVIVGLRMNGRRLKRLERVCTEQRIRMAMAGIGDEGIDADRYRYRSA